MPLVWAPSFPPEALAGSLMTEAFLPTSFITEVWTHGVALCVCCECARLARGLRVLPRSSCTLCLHTTLTRGTLCMPPGDGLVCSSRTCPTWKTLTQASLWKARTRSPAPCPHISLMSLSPRSCYSQAQILHTRQAPPHPCTPGSPLSKAKAAAHSREVLQLSPWVFLNTHRALIFNNCSLYMITWEQCSVLRWQTFISGMPVL